MNSSEFSVEHGTINMVLPIDKMKLADNLIYLDGIIYNDFNYSDQGVLEINMPTIQPNSNHILSFDICR